MNPLTVYHPAAGTDIASAVSDRYTFLTTGHMAIMQMNCATVYTTVTMSECIAVRPLVYATTSILINQEKI